MPTVPDYRLVPENIPPGTPEPDGPWTSSRLVASACHDLRQPLWALSLYLDVLAGETADSTLLKQMRHCLEDISWLIGDLLAISTLEAGAKPKEHATFPLQELMEHVESIHSAEARRRKLRLRCRPQDLVLCTDRRLLQRIVDNLVANALRHTEHGGVLVAARRVNGRYWLEIRDTGVGIASEHIAAIFGEFCRLPGQAASGSYGLGLAIAARLARLLSLEIRVCSRPGSGSMFAVELPVIPGRR